MSQWRITFLKTLLISGWNRTCGPLSVGGVLMKASLKNRIVAPVIGLSLLALTAGGCGTLVGATVGGATGAGIGYATGHNVAKYGAIGAGVGGAAGLAYDVWDYRRDRRNRD
jgi:hypothetical protein